MPRSRSHPAVLAVLGFALGAGPAGAQFGGLFGDPPRPPSNVPGRQPPPPPPIQVAPPPQLPESPRAAAPPAGAVQSQPLPPLQPGGAPAAPPAQAGAPPGQRPPRGTPQPANTAPQPGDEVITEMPSQKIVNPIAVFAGLDKITGRITAFDVNIGETVQFGALQVTPRVCYTRPPTETPNTDAFAEVDEITLQGDVKRIFTGWMFASSPGLHGVEHPIYDVWLTDCKGGAPPVAAAPPPPPAPSKPAPTRPATAQRTQNPRAPQQAPANAAPRQPQQAPFGQTLAPPR